MPLLSFAAVRRARDALRRLITFGDADAREAFDREASAYNLRNLRILLPLTSCLHVISIASFVGAEPESPAHASWLTWLVRFHVMFLVGSLSMGVAAYRARAASAPAAGASTPLVGVRLGDAAAMMYVLGTACISANAQQVHPNMNSFTVGTLAAAYFVQPRGRYYISSLFVGTTVVCGAILSAHPERTMRTAQLMSLLVVVAVSAVAYFSMRALRVRELSARLQVERLNADLEHRVAEQVDKITLNAKEIVQLNEQLNQKVHDRSRELSMALARLAEDHHALAPGTVLGDRVEIEARIGEGGMGAVYRARDLVTSGPVAVKVVQAGSANELDGLYRFLREAQALASLTHPAIVRSFHVDVADDGRLFQVMELVSGETLQSRIDREGTLPVAAAARLGAVLADALANAHAAGIVHRDVKPANVMLTTTSPGIKLLDFGVSKLRDARAAHGRTDGNVIGTPEFLSPEQIGDPANVGDRADVYALGLVLYLAISGRPPYDTVSARSWLVAHVVQPPERIALVVKDIDPDVASTVMACLRKAPEERPSASEVARSLAACADRLGCAALESLWQPAGSPPERPSPEPPITGVQRSTTPGRRTLKVVR